MWSNFVFSLGATLPVFAVMVLGYLLRRAGFLTHGFCHVGNQLVFHLALPAMLFRQIAGMGTGVLAHGPFVIFGAAASLLSVFLVWIPARLFLRDKTEVGAFTQGAFRGNTALLGSVFLQSISGSTEYAPLIVLAAVPIYNVFSVIVLSLESGGRGKLDGKRVRQALTNVCKNPIILGIILALPFVIFGIPLPRMADKALASLSGMASPLALLVIGAEFRWEAAVKKLRPTLWAAAVKLLLLPGTMLPLAAALGFRGEALIAYLVMFGTPTAVSSYIMAENMDNDGVLANGIVASTTVFSAVTLTGWIFLLRTLNLI